MTPVPSSPVRAKPRPARPPNAPDMTGRPLPPPRLSLIDRLGRPFESSGAISDQGPSGAPAASDSPAQSCRCTTTATAPSSPGSAPSTPASAPSTPGPAPFSPASAATFALSGASTGQPWPESARAARATPPHGFPAASLRPANCANITAMSSRSSRVVRPAGGTLRFNIRLNASRSPAAVVT